MGLRLICKGRSQTHPHPSLPLEGEGEKRNPSRSTVQRNIIPLWLIPFAIATTLVVAAHVAWWLSLRDGHVPFCVPYIEGCTSISRAARHGLGNHVFRLLMLPCALLVALHWWTSARWLRADAAPGGQGGVVMALGIVGAVALAVYSTFLGSDGEAYRFLRRYGVIVFFGCSYLAQLLFLRAARRAKRVDGELAAAMLAVCVAMLALGVGNTVMTAVVTDAALKDRIENTLEWHLGVLLVAWFALQAVLWRRSGYGVGFTMRSNDL
jgi:hypothetical protein